MTPCINWHVSCICRTGPTLERKTAPRPDRQFKYLPRQTGTLPLALRTGTPHSIVAVPRPLLQRVYAAGRRGTTSLAVKVCTISPR